VHGQIGEHAIWHLPVLGVVHADTVLTTWVVMLVTLPFFAWLGASYRSAYVNRRQTFVEVINYFADLAYGSMGKQGEPYVPFFIALAIFIFLLNEFGAFPFKEPLRLPFGGSPTADINTAMALALLVFVMIQTSGIIKKRGLGFYKHLGQPFPAMIPLNVLEELLRPTTLAARLFFNIFVGELLLFVIVQIITAQVKIGFFDLSLAAAVGPFFLEIFNFFVGLLQAFVFALLSIVYLSLALADDH
jgi:F-type H+-transporting ATPase subunit a